MQGRTRWLAAVAVGVLSLCACSNGGSAKQSETAPPAIVEAVAGSNLRRVVLSAKAVERLGVTTAAVAQGASAGAVGPQAAVPYASVLYDPGGATWVYATVGLRSYQRYPVTVDRIDGDLAYLSAGPPAGTQVVTVGAAEVYGSEFLSEHE
jgi:hypothetical protein